jgi:hypothetical protein
MSWLLCKQFFSSCNRCQYIAFSILHFRPPWTKFSGFQILPLVCISQSINVSCNSYLEQRASTTHCYQTLFFAATFTPFQFRPTALASIWTDLLQVLFGHPLHLEPCGFHSRAVQFTSACGFRNVCPNHPHFLCLISSSTGTSAVLLHRSWLLIVSSHLTWRILHRHWFIKVCSCVIIFLDTSHDSLAYNKTDLIFELKILILVLSFSFLEFHMGRGLLKAAPALFLRFIISSWHPPSQLTINPR